MEASQVLGKRWRWIRPVARRYLETFGDRTRPRLREVERFLVNDPSFQRAVEKRANALQIIGWTNTEPRMRPVAAAKNWRILEIPAERDLASWLHVRENELEWFADLKKLEREGRGCALTTLPLSIAREEWSKRAANRGTKRSTQDNATENSF
jgi:RNA-directed DNA polymerase